jgi:sugar O-acyltransferase (sialic acid O-acetyltransferase NeuD family)
MDKVIIYGTGSHAELVYYYMQHFQLYNVKAFTVQNEYLEEKKLMGLSVVPYENILELYPPNEYKIFIAIGPQYVNKAREKMYLDAKAKGYTFVNCICPPAGIFPDLVTGDNVFIGYTSALSPFVKIGNNVSILDSKIAHHCQINDHAFITNSTVGGICTVENNVFIGLGSTIAPHLQIGKNSFIGMKCLITKDVSPGSVYTDNKTTRKRNIDPERIKLM